MTNHPPKKDGTATMANYTAADVKRLRDLTGSGMMDCKKALEENDGDFDKAVEYLRIKGAKDVGKRAERATANGLVAADGGAVPEETVANERRIAEETAKEEGKPEAALPKIVEGRVNGFFKDVVLLEQSSVQDSKKTVKAVLDAAGVTVTRFARFEVGQA